GPERPRSGRGTHGVAARRRSLPAPRRRSGSPRAAERGSRRAPGRGGRHAECDEETAGKPAPDARRRAATPESPRERVGEQCVERVRAERDRDEETAEERDLARAVCELGQERE